MLIGLTTLANKVSSPKSIYNSSNDWKWNDVNRVENLPAKYSKRWANTNVPARTHTNTIYINFRAISYAETLKWWYWDGDALAHVMTCLGYIVCLHNSYGLCKLYSVFLKFYIQSDKSNPIGNINDTIMQQCVRCKFGAHAISIIICELIGMVKCDGVPVVTHPNVWRQIFTEK